MTEESKGNAQAPAPAPAPQGAPAEARPKGLAVAGMVLGICGLVFSPPCFLIVIGPIAAVIGIVLSALALSKAKAGAVEMRDIMEKMKREAEKSAPVEPGD